MMTRAVRIDLTEILVAAAINTFSLSILEIDELCALAREKIVMDYAKALHPFTDDVTLCGIAAVVRSGVASGLSPDEQLLLTSLKSFLCSPTFLGALLRRDAMWEHIKNCLDAGARTWVVYLHSDGTQDHLLMIDNGVGFTPFFTGNKKRSMALQKTGGFYADYRVILDDQYNPAAPHLFDPQRQASDKVKANAPKALGGRALGLSELAKQVHYTSDGKSALCVGNADYLSQWTIPFKVENADIHAGGAIWVKDGSPYTPERHNAVALGHSAVAYQEALDNMLWVVEGVKRGGLIAVTRLEAIPEEISLISEESSFLAGKSQLSVAASGEPSRGKEWSLPITCTVVAPLGAIRGVLACLQGTPESTPAGSTESTPVGSKESTPERKERARRLSLAKMKRRPGPLFDDGAALTGGVNHLTIQNQDQDRSVSATVDNSRKVAKKELYSFLGLFAATPVAETPVAETPVHLSQLSQSALSNQASFSAGGREMLSISFSPTVGARS